MNHYQYNSMLKRAFDQILEKQAHSGGGLAVKQLVIITSLDFKMIVKN